MNWWQLIAPKTTERHWIGSSSFNRSGIGGFLFVSTRYRFDCRRRDCSVPFYGRHLICQVDLISAMKDNVCVDCKLCIFSSSVFCGSDLKQYHMDTITAGSAHVLRQHSKLRSFALNASVCVSSAPRIIITVPKAFIAPAIPNSFSKVDSCECRTDMAVPPRWVSITHEDPSDTARFP